MIIAQPDNILIYLPLYIAKEELGFKLLNCGNDDSVIEAVKEGRADISVGDPMMFGEVDFGDVKLISGFINKALLNIITFNQFLDDLKGKVLVTYSQPSTSYNLSKRLADKMGLLLIETPFNTELGPLLTQEADAALILEPNYSQAMRNGARSLLSLSDEPFAFTGFTSKKKQPKFLSALKKAIKIFYEDDVKTLEIAKKYFPLDNEDLMNAIKNIRSLKPYSLKFSKKEIENALKLRGIKFDKLKEKLNEVIK